MQGEMRMAGRKAGILEYKRVPKQSCIRKLLLYDCVAGCMICVCISECLGYHSFCWGNEVCVVHGPT